ncbi:hypothetical protein O3M35_012722 [Rhynocoris fuscipes]|uniref:RING finger protein 37 n=1 Tax=Rhynocoris fuscipes TaxID=488301 RepID=A0AAW1CTD6_9HEMI
MLINFANEELTKEITSDKPCNDTHNVTNLISLDPNKRKNGFLVEYFVKPPVIINLEFICSIIIKEISINCQVGIQKSSSIEIFTKQNGRTQQVIVGKSVLKENENCVNFVLHGSEQKANNCVTFRLSKYMCNVNEISVKILRTQGSTLAALGKLEVWGKPSKLVDREIVKNVINIWTKLNTKPVVNLDKLKPTTSVIKKPIFRYCREVKIPDVDVPEEFLDPITCEILIIPMTLPSGKIVDASTIERFNKIEETFGRLPSDPFTGIIYSESNYPVVATSLKARLDKFLLNYSHIPKLKSIPRTVGRAPKSESINRQVSTSNIDNNSQPSTSQQKHIRTVDDLLESCLNGLPSYLEKAPVISKVIDCIKCNSKSVLFKLDCNDFICRSCLLHFKNENINSCIKCKNPIDLRKAERFHNS